MNAYGQAHPRVNECDLRERSSAANARCQECNFLESGDIESPSQRSGSSHVGEYDLHERNDAANTWCHKAIFMMRSLVYCFGQARTPVTIVYGPELLA